MKEVKNGTTAEVKPVALDSNTEQQGCSFVLYTERHGQNAAAARAAPAHPVHRNRCDDRQDQ
jgi:hypothetical protein